MERKTWVILVAVVVLLIAVVAYGGYKSWSENQYAQAATAICGGVANTNQAFAVYAAKVDDFSGLKDKCEKASADLGSQAVVLDSLGTKGVPDKYVGFHKNLQALIAGYQGFYTKVAAEAASWNKSSFEAVEAMRSVTLQSANSCSSTWPSALSPIKSDPTWCVTLSVDLKKLADSKKSAASSTSGPTVIVAGGIPTTGGVVIALPSIGGQINYNPSAGYLSEMRSLLGGYKSLRGDLDRATEVYDKTNVISKNLLEQARDSRQNILNAVSRISPPAEYKPAHDTAIEVLTNSVNAVNAFLNYGDRWGEFHRLSNVNTPKVVQLQSIYGF